MSAGWISSRQMWRGIPQRSMHGCSGQIRFWTTRWRLFQGANQSGSPEPKMATTGFPSAAARWAGNESWQSRASPPPQTSNAPPPSREVRPTSPSAIVSTATSHGGGFPARAWNFFGAAAQEPKEQKNRIGTPKPPPFGSSAGYAGSADPIAGDAKAWAGKPPGTARRATAFSAPVQSVHKSWSYPPETQRAAKPRFRRQRGCSAGPPKHRRWRKNPAPPIRAPSPAQRAGIRKAPPMVLPSKGASIRGSRGDFQEGGRPPPTPGGKEHGPRTPQPPLAKKAATPRHRRDGGVQSRAVGVSQKFFSQRHGAHGVFQKFPRRVRCAAVWKIPHLENHQRLAR